MMIHEITVKVGKYKDRKRIGRGDASGQGGTSGRGHNGARSRAGWSSRPHYEGGQMQYFRRLPKRGFSNAAFRTRYHIVNIKTLEARCKDGTEVTAEALAGLGVIRDANLPLKVLGEGALTKKLQVIAVKFSASAREKIEKAGGTATENPVVKWTRARAAAKKRSS